MRLLQTYKSYLFMQAHAHHTWHVSGSWGLLYYKYGIRARKLGGTR